MSEEKIVTIRLSRKDAGVLCMMNGFALGAWSNQNGEINPDFLRVMDKVLVQLSPENYTYSADRSEIEKQLRDEGALS